MTLKFTCTTALAIVAANLTLPQDVLAQAVPQATQAGSGATVYGSDGKKIGSIVHVEDEMIILEVGDRAVPIPARAVAVGEKGPAINITRTELVSQFDQQMAAFEARLDEALAEGANVQTADGQALGSVQSASNTDVMVKSADGLLTLPRQLLTLNKEGDLLARITMAQIKQAISASQNQG